MKTVTSIHRLLLALLSLLATSMTTATPASPGIIVPILYLHQAVELPPVLSNILPPEPDSGLLGAQVGIADSNTTGRFLGQHFSLQVTEVANAGEAIDQARSWLNSGNSLILAHVPASTLKQIVKLENTVGDTLVLNISATDDDLRKDQCATGLLHTIPSRAMLADALTQFLIARQWKKWLLVKGQRAEDEAFASALRRSSKRFGGKIVAEKTWSFDTDLRRTAQQELPLFTQADNYDVTLVADELGDVGEYIPYNTWLPRPVAGTQGLTPIAWHPVIEQWGAIQLQNRFRGHAGRPMNDIDYAGWLAVRVIAEAVTRTGQNDPSSLYAYLHSENFEIAAFKGRKLTFRSWNGQLRQPVPLVHPRALVSQSPQPGFLHPNSELDTLGFDQPEVSCQYELTL